MSENNESNAAAKTGVQARIGVKYREEVRSALKEQLGLTVV